MKLIKRRRKLLIDKRDAERWRLTSAFQCLSSENARSRAAWRLMVSILLHAIVAQINHNAVIIVGGRQAGWPLQPGVRAVDYVLELACFVIEHLNAIGFFHSSRQQKSCSRRERKRVRVRNELSLTSRFFRFC